ncbi:MAG: hypothetical protein ABL996_16555 [Micropepsaceae bacterium]
MSHPIDSVIFDLGGVVVDWNPRHLYRELFAGPRLMPRLLPHSRAIW